MNDKQAADLTQRIELLEASMMLRKGWLVGMDDRLKAIDARLSSLVDGHSGLSALLAAAMSEGESWKKDVEPRLSNLDRKADQISRELNHLSTRLQDSHERWEGQKVRIDRQVGTMDDLLKRFEAWKTVGNEMGEQVDTHQSTLVSHDEQLEMHGKMLTHMVELSAAMRDFMREVQQILGTKSGELPRDVAKPNDVL